MHARTGCDMNLRSVQFAKKQHERCESHSLKHCKLGISKIITTAVTDADIKVLERYEVLIYSRTLQLTEAIQQLTLLPWKQTIRKYTPITCSLMSTCKPSSLPSRPHRGTGFVNNHVIIMDHLCDERVKKTLSHPYVSLIYCNHADFQLTLCLSCTAWLDMFK